MTKRTHRSSSSSSVTPKTYTYPDLLDFVIPSGSQPCSYFQGLQLQFNNAILELQNLGIVFDNVPQQVERTFSEMEQNFTDYNAQSKNDQLPQQILDDTQSVIDKAPNLVTLSQRNNYINKLQASLDQINYYYNNDACTFTARIRIPNTQNYLCVLSDESIKIVDSDMLLDSCDQL